MGDIHHLCVRRSADRALLSVHLHQVLLQREEEEAAAEEGREHQPEGRQRENHHISGGSLPVPTMMKRTQFPA